MVASSRGPGNSKENGEMHEDGMRSGSSGGKVQVDPRVQTEIGKHLRTIYDDVINEPVPSRFMELLEQLERSTQKG